MNLSNKSDFNILLSNILENKQLHIILCCLLVSVYCLSYMDASLSLDSARDLYRAKQIVKGEQIILQGPILAGSLHLGPIWFYWLALPALFGSKIAIILWIGLTASLQFLFAYLLAARLINRNFAILLIAVMTLPGWNSFEQITFSHTNIVQPAVFAFLFVLLRLWQDQRGSDLKWLALAYVIALHAHPTTYSLLFFAFPFLAVLFYKKVFSLADIGLAVIFGLALLFPYIIYQMMNAWPDFHSASDFGKHNFNRAGLEKIPRLVLSLFVDGPTLIAELIALNSPLAGKLIGYLYWLVLGLAFGGYCIGLFFNRLRLSCIFYMIALFIVCLLGVLMIREVTPFYMSYTIYPAVSLIIAYGVYLIFSFSPVALTIPALCVALFNLSCVWFYTYSSADTRGAVFPSSQLTNIMLKRTSDWPAAETNFQNDPVTARTGKALENWLCHHADSQLHGPVIPTLDLTLAYPMLFSCEGKELMISGEQTGNLLLGSSIYQQINQFLGSLSPKKTGNFYWFADAMPLKSTAFSLADIKGYTYPPRQFITPQDTVFINKQLPDNAVVVISDYLSFYKPRSVPLVNINGLRVFPIAQNYHTFVYACQDCKKPANWQIDVKKVDKNALSIVYLLPRPK